MATRNDYIYVKLKSKNMFKYIPNTNGNELSDVTKERLGFYHLVLEKITGIQDANDIQNLIQDQEYVQFTNGIQERDYGIDVVYINDEAVPEKEIMLFNFKYREKFNPDKTCDEGSMTDSIKFFQYLIDGSRVPKGMNKQSNTYKNIKKIRDCLKTDNAYKIMLYLVTNEANGLKHESNELIKLFEDNYTMKVNVISLDDIMAFIESDRSCATSKIIVSKDDIITYSVDEKSTSISYICKLSLLDMIRITCTNEKLRGTYNLENIDEEKLLNAKLHYPILYDNVRGYLGETNYNKNISKTIQNDGKNFFMYNNGITITSSNITCEPVSLGKKYLLIISDFQVVNGGQTLRSIYKYLHNKNISDALKELSESKVLVRIFKIESEMDTLKNNIAEYTNSQNAISPIDLKSVTKIQIDLERYLKEQKILYARKSGDVGDENVNYELRISMEKFTQILYASQGYPERVSNIKKRLFSEYYDDIYNNDFKIEGSKRLIENYFGIERYYKAKGINIYDQKIFYIIYMMDAYEFTIEQSVNMLDAILEKYAGTLKETRVLLRKDFKEYLNEQVSKRIVSHP